MVLKPTIPLLGVLKLIIALAQIRYSKIYGSVVAKNANTYNMQCELCKRLITLPRCQHWHLHARPQMVVFDIQHISVTFVANSCLYD